MKRLQMVVLVALLVVTGGGVASAMHHEPSLAKGKALFNDVQLGSSGKTCNTCHPDGRGLEKAGANAQLAEIVNSCIAGPLQGKVLDPRSVEMQSLLLYIKSLGKP